MGEWVAVLELALTGLLGATLVYAIRLHRAIAAMRADRGELAGEFADAVAGFDSGTRQAEAGVSRLREAAQQVAAQLDQAGALKDDLAFLAERGEALADRLDGLIRATRTMEGAAAGPAGPAMRSQAERDLVLALRGGR